MTDSEIDAIVEDALDECEDVALCIECETPLDEFEIDAGICDQCAEEVDEVH